jgi:hypothetical protein
MDRRQAAAVLAQAKWLKDQIKAVEDEAKKVIAGELDGGERTTARTADGIELGRVSMVEGSKSMKIDNEEGFLMWVKQRYPTEIVETVRESFVKVCAEKAKKLGGVPDANGEMCPHVSVVQSASYPLTKLNDDADNIMQTLVHRARLADVLRPQLGAPQPVGTFKDGLIGEPVVVEGDSEDWNATFEVPVEDGMPYVISPDPDGTPDEPVTDPEPFIEEGPPNWPESNTFETRDAVKRRR